MTTYHSPEDTNAARVIFALPASLKTRIQAQAVREGVTMAYLLRKMAELYLDKHESHNDPPLTVQGTDNIEREF